MLWPAFWILVVAVVWLFLSGRLRIEYGRRPTLPIVDWEHEEAPTHWGTIVDPDGDCRPRWQEGRLSFEVPGGVHELQGNGKQNAPRTLRKVDGDFAVEVELTGKWNPQSGGSFPFSPYQGAGILIWLGESDFLRFERAKIKTPVGGGVNYVHFEEHNSRFPRPLGSARLKEGEFPILRVERHGDQFFAMIHRGNGWKVIGVTTTSAPNEIDAGVAAVANTVEVFPVQFVKVQFQKPKV